MQHAFVTLTALLLATPAAVAGAAPKPDLLIILADDLGYGELGCQGNKQIPTPHLDSIGRFNPVDAGTKSSLTKKRRNQTTGE